MATAFPAAADLEEAILALNLIPAADQAEVLTRLNLESKASAAQRAWENATGWHPFLKDSADVIRYFDPPGGRTGTLLEFNAGLVTLTSLITAYSPSAAGTTLTENVDFWLLPETAAVEGRPYEAVRFYGVPFGDPRSIKITGEWGFAATIPEDVWQAVLGYGVGMCAPSLSSRISGGVQSVQTPDISLTFGGKVLQSEAAGWRQAWDEAVKSYRRLVL